MNKEIAFTHNSQLSSPSSLIALNPRSIHDYSRLIPLVRNEYRGGDALITKAVHIANINSNHFIDFVEFQQTMDKRTLQEVI